MTQHSNYRTVLALRELAHRLEYRAEWVGELINPVLSEVEGLDDAERLLTVLLDGVQLNDTANHGSMFTSFGQFVESDAETTRTKGETA